MTIILKREIRSIKHVLIFPAGIELDAEHKGIGYYVKHQFEDIEILIAYSNIAKINKNENEEHQSAE